MKQTFVLALCFLASLVGFAQTMEKTPYGVRTKLTVCDIEFRFLGPDMVRVLKTPRNRIATHSSLSVIKEPQRTDIQLSESTDTYTIRTTDLRIDVTISNGNIRYRDAQNKPLLEERPITTLVLPNGYFPEDSSYRIEQSFLQFKDDAIYGMGQLQNGKLNQRNQRIRLRQDNGKICIPYFQSSRGYALFWDNASPTLFVDSKDETSYISEMGDCVDYYFITGKPGDELLAKMRQLTGQVPMLPLWAFGFFQSKEQYQSQEELVNVVQTYRNQSIPLDGIVQDAKYWGEDANWNAMTFDNKAYSQPKLMIDQVHTLNAHLMLSVWPSFGPNTRQFEELRRRNMILDFESWPREKGIRNYDPFNPKAREMYWNYMDKNLFNRGVDAWWLDATEPEYYKVSTAQYQQPTYIGPYQKYCNAYPLMTNKGVYENQRAKTSEKRVVILTRSAFAGQQRYSTICSSGDVVSSWATLGQQIPAALNLSVSGMPYWNADIGGFTTAKNFPDGLNDKTYHELYVRWMQFATFTPMMRAHGTDIPREIYQFGKPGDWAYDAQAKAIRLRYRLLPYLYATAWQVSQQSSTFMRPLFFDFPNDSSVVNTTDEYLFGLSFLVAPVLKPHYVIKEKNAYKEQFNTLQDRSVYLPGTNRWIDFWTGESLKGGQTISKKTPIDEIPLFVKAGSIIPWGPEVQYATQTKWETLEIRVYPGADGEFTLYEDEGESYRYEQGAFSTITFTYNNAKKTLTIGERAGQFEGMLKKRVFNVVAINKKNNPADKTVKKVKRKVKYTGKSVTVKL